MDQLRQLKRSVRHLLARIAAVQACGLRARMESSDLKSLSSETSLRHAALVVGIAFIISAVLVTVVDDLLLANFVIPGDAVVLANDIAASRERFIVAALVYLSVLLLDSIIGIALLILIRPAGQYMAFAVGGLRIAYAITLAIAVTGLMFQLVDAQLFSAIKLFGYLFFATHIFVLGAAIVKASYLPNFIGVFLLVASVAYGVFFFDIALPEALSLAAMLIMALAELSLSIWLIVARNRLRLSID